MCFVCVCALVGKEMETGRPTSTDNVCIFHQGKYPSLCDHGFQSVHPNNLNLHSPYLCGLAYFSWRGSHTHTHSTVLKPLTRTGCGSVGDQDGGPL